MDIKDALHYDPDTGIFSWKVTVGRRAIKGNKAGCLKPAGYIVIFYKKRAYFAHRLAFLIMTGAMPAHGEEVDHIDGRRSNNVWSNLRKCVKRENQQNRKLDVDSSSGLMGACKVRNKWYAQISHNGRKYSLGYHDTKEGAHLAYLAKKSELHTFNPIPRDYK